MDWHSRDRRANPRSVSCDRLEQPGGSHRTLCMVQNACRDNLQIAIAIDHKAPKFVKIVAMHKVYGNMHMQADKKDIKTP